MDVWSTASGSEKRLRSIRLKVRDYWLSQECRKEKNIKVELNVHLPQTPKTLFSVENF